jgi:hypothetical protein
LNGSDPVSARGGKRYVFIQPEKSTVNVPRLNLMFAACHRLCSNGLLTWFQDLTEVGYVEEEYSVSGLANIYGYVNDAGQSPDVEVIEADVPYTTRILVRRPAAPARFNGTVIYEIMNATAGWDGDPIWQSNFEYMTREGAVWVGMSTKPVVVDFLRDGWAAWPLVTRNASRYQSMSMPHFGQVWDMLNQTGLLLKTPASPDNPLADFDVERIIMVGYSQSAGYQVTHANSFHSMATTPWGLPIIDGYFISAGGATAKHVTGPTETTPESLPFGDARNMLLSDAPSFRFQTQTEVVGFGAFAVRQSESDNPMMRFYEMAGGSHVDADINVIGGQALVRDLGLPPSFCPTPAVPYNPIIIGFVQSALLDELAQWVSYGTEPPASRFMDLSFPGGVPTIALDANGNAIGGVRPPQIDVPLGSYLPNNSGPGFCFLFGGFDPFDDDTLNSLYRNHGSYVSQLVRAIKHSEQEGFLLREDAATQRMDAAASDVGKKQSTARHLNR